MLKSILIENYQSHKETYIEFSPGVTVFSGTSHMGKSAIIRALELIFLNRPSGLEFKSWFASDKEDVSITAEFDEGWVKRVKGEKENKYQVGSPDDDEGFSLKALRTDVPEEVMDLIQIDERNIQGQGDGYFVLSSSPGQVGRRLNATLGLSIINSIVNVANLEVKKKATLIEATEEELRQNKSLLPELDYLVELEPLFKKIDESIDELLGAEKELEKINKLTEEITKKQQLVSEYQELVDLMKPTVTALLTKIDILRQTEQTLVLIGTIVKRIEDDQEYVDSVQSWLEIQIPAQNILDKIKQTKAFHAESKVILSVCLSITDSQKVEISKGETLRTLRSRVSSLEKQLDYCTKCGAHKDHWRK